MPTYRLNPRSQEKMLWLIRAGKTIDLPFSFTTFDEQDLAGPLPVNWGEYSSWFLGLREGAPDPASDTSYRTTFGDFSFPFTKGGSNVVYLSALRQIARNKNNPQDIADAAQQGLDIADSQKLSGVVANSPRYLEQIERFAIGTAQAQTVRGRLCFAGSLRIAAEAQGSAKTPKRFSMVAYTGGPMKLEGWRFPVVVDLDGLEGLDRVHPSFRSHSDDRIVGHIDRVWIDGGKLKAEGIISGAGAAAQEVLDSNNNGFPWQASIGASTNEVEFVPKGQAGNANGRNWPGPVNIARKATLGEISFVPRGADPHTSVTIGAKATKADVVFGQALASLDRREAQLTSEQEQEAGESRAKSAIDRVFSRFGI